MNVNKKQIGTVDLTPTWRAAVRIYIDVLENSEASYNGKRAAREDLMLLAKSMDKINDEKRIARNDS